MTFVPVFFSRVLLIVWLMLSSYNHAYLILNNTKRPIKINYLGDKEQHGMSIVPANGVLILSKEYTQFTISEGSGTSFGPPSIVKSVKDYSPVQLADNATIFIIQKLEDENFFTIKPSVESEISLKEKQDKASADAELQQKLNQEKEEAQKKKAKEEAEFQQKRLLEEAQLLQQIEALKEELRKTQANNTEKFEQDQEEYRKKLALKVVAAGLSGVAALTFWVLNSKNQGVQQK